MAGKVALGKVFFFSEYFGFSPVRIVSLTSHTPSLIHIPHRYYVITEINSVIKQNTINQQKKPQQVRSLHKVLL